MRHHALGVNYLDVYHRIGYPIPVPVPRGAQEGRYRRDRRDGVTELSAGDRVAYASSPIGAYAEARNMPAQRGAMHHRYVLHRTQSPHAPVEIPRLVSELRKAALF